MTEAIYQPYLPVLSRLLLALALGVFVGLERERRGKEAGARTFGFVALLGCLGGLLGPAYAVISLVLTGALIVLLNWQRIHANEAAELTTSVALLLAGYIGVLCGQGQAFTPVAVGVATAALLAWKQPLTDFSAGLTEEEIRSAILLAILTFIVYPVLPGKAIDPWNFVEPRIIWMTVILVAALGFVNYILWKIYGTRGMELGAFLGGLVNSFAAIVELSREARQTESPEAIHTTYRGIILAGLGMLIRNAVLLAVLSFASFAATATPFVTAIAACFLTAFIKLPGKAPVDPKASSFKLEAPFSLAAALEFGFIFLLLHTAGILAARYFGQTGFYAVCFIGGLVSSSSAVAAAATLATRHQMTAWVAGLGALSASAGSLLIIVPLVWRLSRQKVLTQRLSLALAAVMLIVLAGVAAQTALPVF